MLSVSLAALADAVPPGSYGDGSPIVTTGKPISGTSISYTDSVYSGGSNPFCSSCLDFVITVDDPGISDGVMSVSTTGFAGYAVSFAYANDGDVAPTSASTNSNGNKVTFDINLFNDDSDPLIIYTNAQAYTSGGLTINYEQTDPPAFAPSGTPVVGTTPEPSSFLLLGTGLLGAAGVLRRKLA